MSVTQYVGARYVPLFADPLTWDITKTYEPLTIVYYQGNSFTSRQAVPAGIDITNDDYWALTGNYNAQIEQYRTEVQTYDNRITANTNSNTAQDAQLAGTASSGLKTLIDATATDIDALEAADTAFTAQMAGTTSSGLKTLIESNASDIDELETTLTGFDSINQVKTYVDDAVSQLTARKKMLVIGDSLSGTSYVQASARWCVKLANYLNADLYVFSANGAGYAEPGTGSKTFQTLISDAHASTSFDDTDIDYMFIFGGTNDISATMMAAACTTAFDATLNLARQYFTNAELYICTPTSRYDHLKLVSSTRQGELYQLKQWRQRYTVRTNNAIILPLTFITAFNSSYYLGNDDHIHLNEAGHERIANAIYSMMHGGIVAEYFTCPIRNASNTEIGTLRVTASQFGMQVFGFTTSAAGSDSYAHDDFLIFEDMGLNNFFNGVVIAGANGGYIGAYSDANSGLHMVGYGSYNCYMSYI